MDTCGFPKDNFYYYQVVVDVQTGVASVCRTGTGRARKARIFWYALSNCEEVELFLNGASLGKQQMKRNDRLSWSVKYSPGTLSAKGFNGGRLVAENKVETTGEPSAITLAPDRSGIRADGEDLSIVSVAVTDTNGRIVPTAGNKINFALSGPGKIIGVGNGDPSCHEPDTFIAPAPIITEVGLKDWRWKMATVSGDGASNPEIAPSFDDNGWDKVPPDTDESGIRAREEVKGNESDIFRTHVTLTDADLSKFPSQILFPAIYGESQVFINGHPAGSASGIIPHVLFDFKKLLHAGDNVVAVLVKPSVHWGYRGGLNPNVTLKLCHDNPKQPAWSRSVFNGLAQIIVQSAKKGGKLTLTAIADGLKPATTEIETQACVPRPAVE